MIYPGDPVSVILDLQPPDGSSVQINAAPVLMIVNALTGEPVFSSPEPMQPSAMNPAVFFYTWSTGGLPDGWYLGFATYAANGDSVNNRLIGQWKLGDSRIRGEVAREAIVAKEATTAKTSDVLTPEQFSQALALPPGVSGTPGSVLAEVLAKVSRLPYNPAASEDLSDIRQKVDALHGHAFGRWELNRATGEMILYGPMSSSPIARFQLTRSGDWTFREPI